MYLSFLHAFTFSNKNFTDPGDFYLSCSLKIFSKFYLFGYFMFTLSMTIIFTSAPFEIFVFFQVILFGW